MQILVARQPIFDRSDALYGYDLMLRRSGGDGGDQPAPEQLVVDTFLGIGIDQVAAGRRAFVRVDRDMILSGAIRLLPAERVVLQLPADADADRELMAVCEQLRWARYSFSVESPTPETLSDDILRLVQIVKIDVAATKPEFLAELAPWLRGCGVTLLALRVRQRDERDKCRALGFELFEGHGFSAPETLTRRDLPIEHIATFRLLKLMRDPKTSDVEIEELLKRDVSLSYKLLRMVNSAAVGGRNIWSIGHALRLLGRDYVIRWLGMLLVTDGKRDGVRSELIHLSLFRARMCELLATASGIPRARGPLFLVGMFSVLDQILETPMEKLADSMELASDVRIALLERGDFYGEVLSLIEAYERGEWETVDVLSASLGISTADLPPLYLSALAWATEQQAPPDSVPAPNHSARSASVGSTSVARRPGR